MAKYTKSFQGNYNHFLKYIENEIIQGSMSATIEDRHQSVINNVQCTILVFERYSYVGDNRVSLNVTLFQNGSGPIQLSAIAAGGSQAMLFKINTWGEEAFLDKLKELL